jgi:hypothetical protein
MYNRRNLIVAVLRILSRANNEKWFNFYLDFGVLVSRWTPAALGIAALYPEHEKLVATADLLLEQLRKSFLTDDIRALDKQRDDCITGLKMALRSLLKSSDPDKRKNAGKLKKVIDDYGNIARMDYDTESAAVYNLLQDLLGKYIAEVKKLELEGWVTDLERYNTQIRTLTTARYAEKAEKPDMKLADVRRQVDNSYSMLIKVIEVFIITNPDSNLDDFVKELNIIINHYKTVDAQKQGRKNAKNTNAEE